MIHKVNYLRESVRNGNSKTARSNFRLLNVPKSWLEIFFKVRSYIFSHIFSQLLNGFAHQQSTSHRPTNYLDINSIELRAEYSHSHLFALTHPIDQQIAHGKVQSVTVSCWWIVPGGQNTV